MRKCLLWTAAFICLVTIIYVARLSAQDAVNPAASPFPEEALAAFPAIGVPGPEAPNAAPPTEAARANDAEVPWQPKLQVKLKTRPVGDNTMEVTDLRSDGTRHRRTVQVPGHSEFNFVILKCDDIDINIETREDGTLAYGFSCKGRAVITVGGNTISADSIISGDGTLTINNPVVEMFNQTTLRSEKMTLEFPVFSVSISSTAAAPLKPLPDPIGAVGS